jgi:asparagine synthase (glutamine-hydrolysing)
VPIEQIPGDFIAWSTPHAAPHTLVTSALSALPYFHTLSPDLKTWHHRPTVVDCLHASARPWEWNDEAAMSVLLLGHTHGTQTLAKSVSRVPAASQITFDQGQLSSTPLSSSPTLLPMSDAEIIDEISDLLVTIVRDISLGAPTALSLSAGYDSRLLLAILLHLGLRPTLATMGTTESTDVAVASRIAKDVDLPHRQVSLDPKDYLLHAREIVQLTSGTKTADNWHTYLFAREAGFDPSAIHWAGSNGEFVRSYYFDKGCLALASQMAPSQLAARFLTLKNSIARRLPPTGGKGLLTDRALATSVLASISARVPKHTNWLQALDEFYAFERVRHFIGNGLALYNRFNRTFSPFLDGRFLQLARRLPRKWKLNSRLHRTLIERFCPKLLDYPVAADGIPMRALNKAGSWLRRQPVTGYSVFGQVCDLPEFIEIIQESPHLDHFLDRKSRSLALQNKRSGLLGALLAFHHAGILREEHNRSISMPQNSPVA